MKRDCLVIVTLVLIASLLLAPVQASITTYIWDNIHFIDGTGIDYPHPDRDYYDISISSDWTVTGTKLYHNQINHDDSELAAGAGVVGACGLIGLAVGFMIGGAEGSLVGGVVGILLGVYAAGIGVVLKDEEGCIWFWISISFMDWLIDNAYWLGPLCIVSPAVAQITIESAFLLYGYFRLGSITIYDAISKGEPGPPCSLSISTTLWGYTIPYEGTYSYEHDARVTVYAIPWEGCVFDYWTLDGTIKYGSPITITMDTSHSLKAYFHDPSPGGGDGCPTLFVWNGDSYVDYGIIGIHNPSGEDVIREVPIQVEDVDISNYKVKFRLREGWPGLNFSESVIDQVKLYATGNDGHRYLCPLISAEHNSSGNVLPQLLLSDEWKVQTLLLETTDLTFLMPYQNIQSYTFTIEGCNQLKE